jgi:hypothetical protein
MKKKLVTLFVIFSMISPSIIFGHQTGRSNGNWSMLGGDPAHTAIADATLIPRIGWNTPTRWQYDLEIKDHESVIWSSPISDGEDVYLAYGTFYEGAGYFNDSGIIRIDTGDDELYFKVDQRSNMDLSGMSTTNHFIPTPALHIEEDKTSAVYVDSKGNVYMEGGRRGHHKEEKNENRPIVSSPVIYNNQIFCGTESGYVLSISIDGFSTKKYTDEHMDKISGSVAINDGIMTFGDSAGNIYVFDVNEGGKLLARGNVNPTDQDYELTLYTPSIASDSDRQIAVFGSTYGYIHVVSLNEGSYGKSQSQKISNTTFHSAPIILNGYIYIGDIDGNLFKVSLDGLEVVNKTTLDYGIRSQPVFCNGFLYVTTKDIGSERGQLYILNAQTLERKVRGIKLTPKNIFGSTSSPMIIDNYLFVPSSNGKVYRFEGQRAIADVSPDNLDFGIIYDRANIKKKAFTIKNVGGGLDTLDGIIETNPEWIKCEPSSFSLLKGEEIQVEVSVIVTSDIIPFGKNTDEINIIVDDQTIETVEVNYTLVEAPARITISPDAIDFGIIIQGEKVSDTFTVSMIEEDRDLGRETRYFIEPEDGDTISVSRDFLHLYDQNHSLITTITIDTSTLDVGIYDTKIFLFRDKRIDRDVKTITIRFEVAKKPPKPQIENNIKTLPIPDIMASDEEIVSFTISNDLSEGEREPLTIDSGPTLEPSYEWFSASAEFTDDTHNEIKISCSADVAMASFWPNESHQISISITVCEQIYTLTVNILTETTDSCEISFFIDSNSYTVNGRQLYVTPAPFISENGNTMVPIRFIADPLEQFFGASIEWIPDLQTVIFILGDTVLRLIIGYEEAIIELPDGSIETSPMNSPAMIVDGRTFIPPRTIAEAFDAKVEWIPTERKSVFTFTNPD